MRAVDFEAAARSVGVGQRLAGDDRRDAIGVRAEALAEGFDRLRVAKAAVDPELHRGQAFQQRGQDVELQFAALQRIEVGNVEGVARRAREQAATGEEREYISSLSLSESVRVTGM